MKKAAIYARVSTDEQANKGYSIPTQVEACQRYAQAHGLEVVIEYLEDESGAKLVRPELDKLRAQIDRGEIEAVIVYSSDRFTRSLAHSLILREELARVSVELHYVTCGKTDDSAEARITANIEAVFNEYWREKTIEATRRGQIGKAKMGLVVGAGVAPYGYRYDTGRLVILEDEANIVRAIYHWYIFGDGDGKPMAYWAIAQKLQTMRVTTPYARRNKKGKPTAGVWRFSSVCNIIGNETYAGVWRWGKQKGAHGEQGKRDLSETIAVEVPPIVSRELWLAAQERRERNKHMSLRNSKADYLLRGRVYCGCGQRMYGAGGQAYRYYRCRMSPHGCQQRHVGAVWLEHEIWARIKQLARDSIEFEGRLRLAQKKIAQDQAPKRRQLEIVSDLIARCEANMLGARAEKRAAKPGGLEAAQAQRDINELETQYTGLIAERDRLALELDREGLTEVQVQQLLEFRSDVEAGLEKPEFEDKRITLEMLNVKITVSGHKASITCHLGPIGDSIDLPIPASTGGSPRAGHDHAAQR